MFGRKKLHPVVTNNDEVYYTPKLTTRDARKMVRQAAKAPAVKDALNELKQLQKFRDMSLSTASNPNNPMENKYARKQRKKDFIEIQRREKELTKFLSGFGIYPQKGPGNHIVTHEYIANMAKKRHFERGEMMDKEWGNSPDENRLMIYESVADGSISSEMGQYLLHAIAYEEATAILEENETLVKTYLSAIKENDMSTVSACRDELCARKETIPNITEIKSDMCTAFNTLTDTEKLSLRPTHSEILKDEMIDDADDSYDIDDDKKLTCPPKPNFIPTNTEDDKEHLLNIVRESVNNNSLSYSRGAAISDLINKHFSC